MSAQPTQPISINEFILDAMDVAAQLDAIGIRDHRATTLATLEWAEQEYAELVIARKCLPTAGDTAVIDGLLDSIRARLKFFEKRR